ncbi:hypothetical protein [Singulisphaera sp. PoT]|uniref:hypothetical protein n=1 Tax=Singulisphaera sp. PoT TaxID=3411797 RepID=UPI003BF4B872
MADFVRVMLRDRWATIFLSLGWIHLAVFSISQVFYSHGNRSKTLFPALWALEFGANLWVIRKIAGAGWYRSSPFVGILVRVWATFLILSFNVASLNTLTGFTLDWFKSVWTTLSTFGFATTAYLISPWFFVPAVFMYFTGLLMATNPDWNYAIYGIAWWTILESFGILLIRRSRRSNPENELVYKMTDSITPEEIPA